MSERSAFSRDGSRVATASRDDTARVWDVTSGAEIARLMHDAAVNAVAFSRDGSRVVTASSDGTARVWESSSGQEIARLIHDANVTAVAFSRDGRMIATASADNTAEIRYVHTQDLITQACLRLTRNLTLREWRRYIGEEPYRRTCEDLPDPDDLKEDGDQQVR